MRGGAGMRNRSRVRGRPAMLDRSAMRGQRAMLTGSSLFDKSAPLDQPAMLSRSALRRGAIERRRRIDGRPDRVTRLITSRFEGVGSEPGFSVG